MALSKVKPKGVMSTPMLLVSHHCQDVIIRARNMCTTIKSVVAAVHVTPIWQKPIKGLRPYFDLMDRWSNCITMSTMPM